MMTILTIDTGTTNTRVGLWRGGVIAAQMTTQAGVRDTAISGSPVMLQAAVRDTIAATLEQADAGVDQVDLVIASGMITSALGLHEVPHLTAPAGLDDLARGMVCAALPEVFAKPIWFIPGVRNNVPDIGLHNCEAMDMMRGEEVEVMGLLAQVDLAGPLMVILPGSHTKFISLDERGRINACATTLAGELLQTISQNTILAKSLDNKFADAINPDMLLAGAALAGRTGFGRACFSIRILEQFMPCDTNDRANFLLGVVLSADLLALKNSSAVRMHSGTPVVIAGKGVLTQGLSLMIERDDYFSAPVTVIDTGQQALLSGAGAIQVARARGLYRGPDPVSREGIKEMTRY